MNDSEILKLRRFKIHTVIASLIAISFWIYYYFLETYEGLDTVLGRLPVVFFFLWVFIYMIQCFIYKLHSRKLSNKKIHDITFFLCVSIYIIIVRNLMIIVDLLLIPEDINTIDQTSESLFISLNIYPIIIIANIYIGSNLRIKKDIINYILMFIAFSLFIILYLFEKTILEYSYLLYTLIGIFSFNIIMIIFFRYKYKEEES